jgi:metal-responsive CopG/Arc/MetJ family transcriptional regulator
MIATKFRLVLTVSNSMKEELDRVASELGQSRSRFIRDGVTRHLEYHRGGKNLPFCSLTGESLGEKEHAE